MQIYSVATGRTFEEIEAEFAGRGYGDFKKAVGEAVVELLRPIREETERLLADKAYWRACTAPAPKRPPMLPTVPSPRSIKKWASCPADGGCAQWSLKTV